MRIAQVAPPWYPIPPPSYGGIESMLALLVDGLIARGHDVVLYATGETDSQADVRFSFSRAQSDRVGAALPEVLHAAWVANNLDREEFDLIHDHSLAGPLLAGGSTTSTVVTAHGPLDGEFARYYELINPWVHLVAISDAQRRMAPSLHWVRTVYNGMDTDGYPFEADKEDYVLWMGRMNPDKGAHLAIDIARKAGCRIVLAGKCTEQAERDYFEEEISPRLGDGAEWTGEADLDRKKILLAHARCLLFPLQWEEPFGIVMAEAMACGTPVVALGRGSVPEVVVDGVTGFVRREPAELVQALDDVDQIDPKECRRMAEERFGADVMVSAYERVYEEVLGRA